MTLSSNLPQKGFQKNCMKNFFITLILFLGMTVLYGVGKKPSKPKVFSKIDLILVEKVRRVMSVYHQGKVLKSWFCRMC
jgi:hypothetical protein